MDVKQSEVQGLPPLTYGIWIAGKGWLRADNGKTFADPRIEYVNTALRMWRYGLTGGKADVRLIDQSMIDLQSTFLRREQERTLHIEFELNERKSRFIRWWRKLKWAIGKRL